MVVLADEKWNEKAHSRNYHILESLPSPAGILQRNLHSLFGYGIQCTGSLCSEKSQHAHPHRGTSVLTIQEQDLRVPNQSPCDAESLPLSATEICALHPHLGVQPLL